MADIIRWGILGSGRIARKFATDLALLPNARLTAVGSRHADTANSFAQAFNMPHAHASYEALAANPEVDVIYIASPHTEHYAHTLLCLRHGKAVLCEKPFAMNLRQATEMVELARQQKVFLMEAVWTRFSPHFAKVQELLQSGMLGEIKSVLVNFGFRPDPPVPARLTDPALGGGTLLDIGIYNLFIATAVLGQPDAVDASITRSPLGVDEQCAILLRYNNGAMAQLFSTFLSNLATEADINGTAGRLRLTSRFFEQSATLEYYPGRMETKQLIPFDKEPGFGYQYEARHVMQCLQEGLTESPLHSLDDTLALTRLLDRIRSITQLHYPADDQ